MNQIKKFSEEFFLNLKCDVSWNDDLLRVENVPRSFEDLFGQKGPYNLSFSDNGKGFSPRDDPAGIEFVRKGSRMLTTMLEYLKGAGKATLLRIDFDVDADLEIKKRLDLRNCELQSLSKGYKNNFFSRFSFAVNFSSLNESERLLSEIYIHDGKVVEGNLSGYTVVDGSDLEIDNEKIKQDYEIAKLRSVELSKDKQNEIAEELKKKVEIEIARIEKHYDKAMKEVGGDLNDKLEKIKEVELMLRSCEDSEKESLRRRLERLRNGLVKVGDDKTAARIEKEKELTIRDVMHKYSLNVDRKLVNTTVIYYPVYTFKLFLKGSGDSGKFIEVKYDPLTKDFSGLDCESCGKVLERVGLCDGGHISCEDCLGRCGECAGVFCAKCLKRSCKACGEKLCKSCIKMCLACGENVCKTHLRKDCVSGEDRCVSCLRACLRCHGMCEEKFFGEALDGSKVCSKCLGKEKSGKVLEQVFRR